MGKNVERARAIREDKSRRCNCSQVVLCAFCEDWGLDVPTAERLAAGFGSGMGCGQVCGAVIGAVMALGLAGKGKAEAARLVSRFKEKNGCLTCGELLAAAEARGEEKKSNCGRLILETTALAEELLAREECGLSAPT